MLVAKAAELVLCGGVLFTSPKEQFDFYLKIKLAS